MIFNIQLMVFLITGSNVQVSSEIIVLNSIVLPYKELNRSYKNEIIL
jgi:mannose-1-phosphate guanylyltransferase